MDRVRFGRALGFGARQAMKTLVTAVDAATAENPSAGKPSPNESSRRTAGPPAGSSSPSRVPTPITVIPAGSDTPTRMAAHSTAKTVTHTPAQSPSGTPAQTRQMKQRLGRGSKRFGEAVWEPFVRLSGVLWLEVTGVFFGLFALVALGYLWKLRGAWHANAPDAASHHSLIGAAIMFVLFGYFCVSSFLRARRRERRR